TPSALNEAINDFLNAHSFPHIRVHDTRHATATILLSLGVHMNMVQKFMRHADVRTTLGVYGHILEEDTTLAQEAMERAYAPSQRGKAPEL
ncbi:MAG TPA: tyrosine-type recombinase/integrase, partial [Ktedonosporobacter sp.]|nr:tyrosine-type recombinase/integrase [Ktedonosporobacter sp.]